MSTQQNGGGGTLTKFSHLSTNNSELDASYVRSAPDFLCVIFDLDPYAWSATASASGSGSEGGGKDGLQALQRATQDVCIFLNAHTALRHDNACAVYAAGRSSGSLVFSNAPFVSSQSGTSQSSAADSISSKADANTFQPFKVVSNAVLQGFQKHLLESKDELDLPPSAGIVSSLSQALCHINRLNLSTTGGGGGAGGGGSAGGGSAAANAVGDNSEGKGNTLARSFQSRILILTASPDSSSQYVSVMNCIFGAQKKGVMIDVCKLFGGKDSVFLQQASHLTGGTYFRLENVAGLLQTLMTGFLASPSIRNQIRLPSNDDVDFRAACFCHGSVVDVGYVCSVCLSIFCEPPERCITCRALFPKRTLQRYQDEIKAIKG